MWPFIILLFTSHCGHCLPRESSSMTIISAPSMALTQAVKTTHSCRGLDSYKCKPTSVEFFASSANRDGEKLMLLAFDHLDLNGHKPHQHSAPKDDSDFHRKFTESSHPGKNLRNLLSVCAPENENLQTSSLTNQINMMSHVFCRQMGYMTYTSRRAANVLDDDNHDKVVWPSAICNGTEQRLEDCYWPEVTVTKCRQVIEVTCGTCSKYYSHVDDGVILTPGFPNSFPFTVQCDWLIYTHLGQGIELKFSTFNFPTSQLPSQQVGSSPCVASNAFLEIRPNDGENQQPLETLSNGQRYCVTKSPDRKMIVKSKAVWIHFSSGIHSGFFFNSFGSRSFIKRPVGLKIYFKALPADAMSDSFSTPESGNWTMTYMIAGGAGLLLLFLSTCFICYLWCLRRRNRQQHNGPDIRNRLSGTSLTTWRKVKSSRHESSSRHVHSLHDSSAFCSSSLSGDPSVTHNFLNGVRRPTPTHRKWRKSYPPGVITTSSNDLHHTRSSGIAASSLSSSNDAGTSVVSNGGGPAAVFTTGRVRDPNGTDESVAMAGVGSNQRTSLYSHEMSMNHYEEIHAMRLPNIPTEQPEYLQIIAE